MAKRALASKTSLGNKSKLDSQDVKWFVLRGFKLSNKDETGFLAIDHSSHSRDLYQIVDDVEDAMRFPSKNVYGIEGFGTPKQWLEFFKGEEALSDWKFHLAKVRN